MLSRICRVLSRCDTKVIQKLLRMRLTRNVI